MSRRARGRAERRGRVCEARRVGGAAAQPAPRRAVQLAGLWGNSASGLCQLTFPPRLISCLSFASSPLYAACHTAFELPEPICSARSWRRVLAARKSRRTSSLTRNRSRKNSGSRGPNGAKHEKLHGEHTHRALEFFSIYGKRATTPINKLVAPPNWQVGHFFWIDYMPLTTSNTLVSVWHAGTRGTHRLCLEPSTIIHLATGHPICVPRRRVPGASEALRKLVYTKCHRACNGCALQKGSVKRL